MIQSLLYLGLRLQVVKLGSLPLDHDSSGGVNIGEVMVERTKHERIYEHQAEKYRGGNSHCDLHLPLGRSFCG